MSEINKVLNDESKNDKELIKELSVYVKNHRDKNLSIDKKFFEDVIDITLKNSEIDFKKIVVIDDVDIKKLEFPAAFWSDAYETLCIDVERIVESSKVMNEEWLNSKMNYKIITYFRAIAVVIHELTHARQYYLIKKGNNDIYTSCQTLINKNHDLYKLHHDEFLIERYAILRAYSIAYEILSYIYPEKAISKLRIIIYRYLLYGYKISNNSGYFEDLIDATIYEDEDAKIISALENYNNIAQDNSLAKIEINPDEPMGLYDRLYLGLPISIEEYFKLLDSTKRLITESGTLKKLINKL